MRILRFGGFAWIFLFFFLFPVPIQAASLQKLAEAEQWEAVLQEASGRKLSAERLYYETKARHELDRPLEAYETALLYLVWDAKDAERRREVLGIAIIDGSAIGDHAVILPLAEGVSLTQEEAAACYASAVATRDVAKAQDLYAEYLEGAMDPATHARMLIRSHSDPSAVLAVFDEVPPEEQVDLYRLLLQNQMDGADLETIATHLESLIGKTGQDRAVYGMLADVQEALGHRVAARSWRVLQERTDQ